MDLSSLPESQQQQIKQLYQQFQEHQQQQQESQPPQSQQQIQPQDYTSQHYDPSQYQAYDQSSYYSYYQYPQDAQQSQQPQQNYTAPQQGDHQYPYYPYGYANGYQQQPNQHESAPTQSSGVQVSHETASAEGSGGQGQNAYYPQGTGEQSGPGFPAPPGLNPAAAAAVAALSQLTQFAGTMGAAERAMGGGVQGRHGKGGGYGPMMGPGPEFFHGGPGAMHPLVGPTLYRGSGRRGGGPFQGRGRDTFGPHHPWTGGARPPLRGRGRGRGRGQRGGPRHFPSCGAMTSSNAGPSTAEEEEPPPVVGEEAAPEKDKAVPIKQPPQKPWCELCRVDCTSMEILEQHKNGKKHKKNLQKLGGMENGNKPEAEMQKEQDPVAASEAEANLPSEANTEENQVETKQQNDTQEQTEVPQETHSDSQARNSRVGKFDNTRHGMKRNMMRGGGGRGGKRMRTFEALWHPMEPPRPKVVIPLICDLCNVKCDTQEVLDCHLSGKKHISKLKRFGDHQAMYGPMGLQALYPPNPIAHTVLLPQGHPQTSYGPPNPFHPAGPYMPPGAGPGAQFQQNPNPQGPGAQFQQNPNPQGAVATVESGNPAASATVLPEAQQQSNTAGTENVDRVDATLDSAVEGTENASRDAQEPGPAPNCGISTEDVTLPGLNAQADEGAIK